MITYEFLQNYWWFLIALLGGLLVFLLFVQGGNALIFLAGRSEAERQLIVNSTGRKWELTFTTLVTFGGAFFASFPLFYSTSFGGAYWVWVLILVTFVLQAVSYEFQSKAGNILGKTTFRITCTTDITVGANGVSGRLGFDFTAAEAVAETPVKATAENVSAAGENWMNLFINADGDYTTGWNGYDYILNRSRDGSTVTVEKFVDNEWKFKTVGTAAYTLENNTLTVQVEDSLVGLTGRTTFDFKAADNSVTDGDILKFMTLGDTAPDNRFAFRYQE